MNRICAAAAALSLVLLIPLQNGAQCMEETDSAHGCDFADVAAKSSSVAMKPEYKTSFWEEKPADSREQSRHTIPEYQRESSVNPNGIVPEFAKEQSADSNGIVPEFVQDSPVDLQEPRIQPQVLPVRYDAREAGRTALLRDQGYENTCWALSAAEALEAALLPERRLVFSAEHMALANSFPGDREGGNYRMIMAYLSGWQGPVAEDGDFETLQDGTAAENGYSGNSQNRLVPEGRDSGNEQDEPACEDEDEQDGPAYEDEQDGPALEDRNDQERPAVLVQEMLLLEEPALETVKEMILRYGAVQTSLYMNRETVITGSGDSLSEVISDYYNEETFSYYVWEAHEPDHDIVVTGWDDTFPAEKFAVNPGCDGAFICQNSWGEGFGEDGFFYVSYADACILHEGIVYAQIDDAGTYDVIYQLDPCGWQARQGYNRESCYSAAVYTAGNAQMLEAAGFYTTGPDTSYEWYLQHHYEGTITRDAFRKMGSGIISCPGFHTVQADERAYLEAGECFAVIVKVTTPGADKPAAVEGPAQTAPGTVLTEGKESYLSLTGERWENTQSSFGTNVCLKAYAKLCE